MWPRGKAKSRISDSGASACDVGQNPGPREPATRTGFNEYVLRQVARRWFAFLVAVLLVTGYMSWLTLG